MTEDKKMLVSKIDKGTVIDKIPSGISLQILKILKIREDVEETVAVAIRVKSKSMGRKDIIKLTHRFLCEDELFKIWIVAPEAVITSIDNYKVQNKIKLSDLQFSNEFEGLLKCNNPTCATNYGEPVTPKFTLIKRDPLLIRCQFCDRVMIEDNIREQLY